jgi:CheY-like chemotaxis protein
VVLTSQGQRVDTALCHEVGIAAYVAKPIKPSLLLDAILTARGAMGERGEAPLPVGRRRVSRAAHPLRVLLAEDNAVNQRIAANVLQKRGHDVTIVGDGRAAVAALEADGGLPFDPSSWTGSCR